MAGDALIDAPPRAAKPAPARHRAAARIDHRDPGGANTRIEPGDHLTPAMVAALRANGFREPEHFVTVGE